MSIDICKHMEQSLACSKHPVLPIMIIFMSCTKKEKCTAILYRRVQKHLPIRIYQEGHCVSLVWERRKLGICLITLLGIMRVLCWGNDAGGTLWTHEHCIVIEHVYLHEISPWGIWVAIVCCYCWSEHNVYGVSLWLVIKQILKVHI